MRFKRPSRHTGILLAFVLMAGASAYANYKAFDVSSRVETESRERRDQSCRGYELTYRQEIEGVKNTYKFILSETPEERKGTLSRFIAAELPRRERAARNDWDEKGVIVPAFCDEPGIGLDEPDPKLPKRPPEVTEIIQRGK